MWEKYTERVLKYHPTHKKLSVSHLMFVDDLMLFSNASVESTMGLKCVLSKFSTVSGLYINEQKSNVFFGGVRQGLGLRF